MSIRLRLILGFGAIAVAVFLTGGIAVYQQMQVARQAAIRDAQHLAENIAQNITYDPTGTTPPLFVIPSELELYTRALYQNDGRDMEVVNRALTIVADKDAPDVGTQDARPVVAQTIADGIPRDMLEQSPDAVPIREVVVPIRGSGRNIGAIVLEYTPLYAEIMARTLHTMELLGIVIVCAVLLAIGLGTAMSRAILNPLRALKDGLTEIASGHAHVRVQARSRNEIGSLIEAFNAMADDLETSRAETEAAQEQATSILQSAGEGLMGVNQDGAITFINPAAAKMLDVEERDVLGERFSDTVGETTSDGAPVAWEESAPHLTLARGIRRHVVNERFRRPDGTTFPVEYLSTPIRKNGAITGAVVTFADIAERVRADEAMARQSQALTAANEEANRSRREVYLLHQMGELLQSCATLEEAYSVFRAVVGQFFPDDTGAVYVIADSRNIVEAMVTWGSHPPENGSAVFAPDECWSLRRGRPHYIDRQTAGLVCKHLPAPPPSASLCVPLVAHGEALGVLYVVPGDGTETRLSEAKQQLANTVAEPLGLALANLRLRQTLRNQSIRDALTGLFNRRYLEETLERELRRAERTHHPVSVIAFDVDLFKQFNDTFGHDAGDALLSEIGAAMRRNFRREDILCRYGGEEFTVILPDTGLDDAVRCADQLRELVAGLNVSHRNRSLGSVTLSLGVASFPEHGTTVDALLRSADQALYRAKEGGRARTEVASPHPAR